MNTSNGQAIVVHGPSYAGYTKVVLLALQEKGVAYELRHFDLPGRPPNFGRLNPFLKVPAIEHGGRALYETSAITRYIDEAFEGAPLQPRDPVARARMNQIVSIMDQVGAPILLRTIYQQRFVERVLKEPHNEAAVTAALPLAETCLDEFERFATDMPFMAGDALSLADLFVFPNLAYFADTAEGAWMLARRPALSSWFERMRARPSSERVGLPELPAPKAA